MNVRLNDYKLSKEDPAVLKLPGNLAFILGMK